ncbi:hypothetical protein RHSIM_Rhsim09G0161500 [Rhododendron simsii]|uniref:DUF674 family protein n=1 Tax=Rhododendron simsii TaxID=118357 RepID=A0A834LG25_RHOSS|nr:hypothetical protein RHSIM_Rhsim09G0161500 [Rhododendron simsii]
MATSSKTKVSLKLLIDTNGKRVLYAEASKDAVDFLFNLLRLPVGAVVEVLKKQTMVGTLGNLFESIENLNETYFQPNTSKQCLLNPKVPIGSSDIISPLLLLDEVSDSVAKRFYVCNNSDDIDSEDDEYDQYYPYVSNDAEALCPNFNLCMCREAVYVAPEDGGGSGISSRGGTICERSVGALEERIVDMGMPEGLKLLKASLQSKTVLTSVFLGNTGAED